MPEFKPDERIWKKINAAVVNENAAVTIVTMISGLCQMLIHAGVCTDEEQARAHLAATILSPDTGPIGSLVPMLQAELDYLRDGARPDA